MVTGKTIGPLPGFTSRKNTTMKQIFALALAGLILGLSSSVLGQFSNPDAIKLAVVMDKVSRYYVDSISDGEVVEDAIKHMLHNLDPHSSYLSSEELEQMNEDLGGEFEGIGVSFNILEDTIYIISPIAGGPSEKVGIMAGDRIVKVEGETVAGTGVTTRDVQALLKGPKGTTVDVSILRRGMAELLDFTISRDKIPVYSVDAAYMVNEKVAYIKLARFSRTTIEEFESAIDELSQEGMESLILDLGGNVGGWLPVAVDLADHFLSGDKEIVSTQGDKVPDRVYRARRSGLFEEGKLVILIDEQSASASEIVAGAVQDWDRGIIVGRRSFGKGLVQQPFALGDGSMIRLTVARYYTPTGRLIQKPYEDGFDAYNMDLIDRYNSGEMTSADSTAFPDSQKYETLKLKRSVYGGGGIMPDHFVAIDTTTYSVYYRKLVNRGIFNRFVLQYVDEHRESLKADHPGFDHYASHFRVEKDLQDALIAFADQEGLEFVVADWEVSGKQISRLLKAHIAGDLWGRPSFFEIYNVHNPSFQKAVEILEEPGLLSEKLAQQSN